MLSRVLRTRQHASIYRLHLHHRFNHTSTLTSEEELLRFKQNANRVRTAFIRTQPMLGSLADTWSLLRAVERNYGKVAEAQFLKVSFQYCPT
jgi:hypothetical protein